MTSGQKFFQDEKEKQKGMVFTGNKLWKQTYEDSQAIRSDKHPKALYVECMKNDQYMHHYAA